MLIVFPKHDTSLQEWGDTEHTGGGVGMKATLNPWSYGVSWGRTIEWTWLQVEL